MEKYYPATSYSQRDDFRDNHETIFIVMNMIKTISELDHEYIEKQGKDVYIYIKQRIDKTLKKTKKEMKFLDRWGYRWNSGWHKMWPYRRLIKNEIYKNHYDSNTFCWMLFAVRRCWL